MPVYTDGVHLVADTIEELHAFALSIGMKRSWFQNHRKPHYDLLGRRAETAYLKGAKKISDRECVRIANECKRKMNGTSNRNRVD